MQALNAQIWAPIEKVLPTETKKVILSPDRQLNFVSFATLLGTDKRSLMFHAIGWSNSVRRKESERFKGFTHEELRKRDKLNLHIFWLKDESLDDSANLPDPDIIAAEIVEDLQAALAKFAEIATDLKN